MTGTVPESLQNEFTQDEWDNLTDAEREGLMEEGQYEEELTPEEQRLQDEADAKREADAIAAATAGQQQEEQGTKTAEQQAIDEAAAAAAAAAAAEENKAPVIPRPRGVIDAELPDDFDQRVANNEKALADLNKAYDDGDISHAEWREQLRKLDRESRELERMKDRAELARESSQQALINHWQGLIQPFIAKHPELGEDQVSMDGFDSYLKQTTAPVMQAGGTPGQAEIDKAYGLWCKRFNFTPAGEQQRAPAPATKTPITAPPTLGGLPVSTSNSVEDGRWAALDRLEGFAYEEALAKLTPAELDAYSQRA